MASYTVNVPAADVPRVLNGFKERFNYNVNRLDLTPDPSSSDPEPTQVWETEVQFAKRMLAEFIRETMLLGEMPAAKSQLVENLKTDIKENTNVTVS